jgi:hypothetical protein
MKFPMAKVVFKDLRMRELPPELTAGLDAAPDDIVRVTVDAGWQEELAELRALSKAASAEARRRGLTEGQLAELHEGGA